jgi:hypothetical protein
MVYIDESCQVERGSKQVRGKREKNHGPSGGVRGVDQPFDEGTPFNPHLKAAIFEVVENQIRDGNPLETRQTLERLLDAGYSRNHAIVIPPTSSRLMPSVLWRVYYREKTAELSILFEKGVGDGVMNPPKMVAVGTPDSESMRYLVDANLVRSQTI